MKDSSDFGVRQQGQQQQRVVLAHLYIPLWFLGGGLCASEVAYVAEESPFLLGKMKQMLGGKICQTGTTKGRKVARIECQSHKTAFATATGNRTSR